MKNITSLKNPAVQDARALATAKERSRQRAFLLDGEHMVGEGLSNCPERIKTVFVDEKLIAGDVVTVYYTGEMYVQESYPGTVVFSGGEVKRVEVQKAKLCILTVTQNAQTGEKQLVNQLDQPLTSAPDYALTDWDGSFVAWKELEVGTVLYGSFLDTTGEIPTEVVGLYAYLPRV